MPAASQPAPLARTSAPSQVAAVVRRNLRECAVNPTISVWGSLTILMGPLFWFLLDEGSDTTIFVVSIALFSTVAMMSTLPVFVMAEDWEHGAVLPILRSGVSPAALAAGHGLSALLYCAEGCTLSYLALSLATDAFPLSKLPLFLLAFASFAVFCCLVSLAAALVTRRQRDVYGNETPVLVFYLSGMVQPLFPEFAGVMQYLPTSLPCQLLSVGLTGTEPLMDWGTITVSALVWTVAAAVAVAVTFRRYRQDLRW